MFSNHKKTCKLICRKMGSKIINLTVFTILISVDLCFSETVTTLYHRNKYFSSYFGVHCAAIRLSDGTDANATAHATANATANATTNANATANSDPSDAVASSICQKFGAEDQTDSEVIKKENAHLKKQNIFNICHCKCPESINTNFDPNTGKCESNLRYANTSGEIHRFGVGCTAQLGTMPNSTNTIACAKYDGIPWKAQLDPPHLDHLDGETDLCHCQCHDYGKTNFTKDTQKCRGTIKKIDRRFDIDRFDVTCANGSDSTVVNMTCRSFFGRARSQGLPPPMTDDHEEFTIGDYLQPLDTCRCECNHYVRRVFNSEIQSCVDVFGDVEHLCMKDIQTHTKHCPKKHHVQLDLIGIPLFHLRHNKPGVIFDDPLLRKMDPFFSVSVDDIQVLHDDKWVNATCFGVNSSITMQSDWYEIKKPFWGYDPNFYQLRGKVIRVRFDKRVFKPRFRLQNSRYCNHHFKMEGIERPRRPLPYCGHTDHSAAVPNAWKTNKYYVIGLVAVFVVIFGFIVGRPAKTIQNRRQATKKGKKMRAEFDCVHPASASDTPISMTPSSSSIASSNASQEHQYKLYGLTPDGSPDLAAFRTPISPTLCGAPSAAAAADASRDYSLKSSTSLIALPFHTTADAIRRASSPVASSNSFSAARTPSSSSSARTTPGSTPPRCGSSAVVEEPRKKRDLTPTRRSFRRVFSTSSTSSRGFFEKTPEVSRGFERVVRFEEGTVVLGVSGGDGGGVGAVDNGIGRGYLAGGNGDDGTGDGGLGAAAGSVVERTPSLEGVRNPAFEVDHDDDPIYEYVT